MSNRRFSGMPNINIPRTRMKQDFTHGTTFNLGELVPIDCFEVLPGDDFNLKLSSLIRMSAPIRPIMDTIEVDVHAFFIPMRLVFKNTAEFFGENKDSAGYQKQEFQIPQAEFDTINPVGISKYLGKPCSDTAYKASLLKERCYALVWSEWYRAQQLQTPFSMLDSDDGDGIIGHIGDTEITPDSDLLKVCKKLDYFTAATIAPQYGPEVLLPLGDYAPVVTGEDNTNLYRSVEAISKIELNDDVEGVHFASKDIAEQAYGYYGFGDTQVNGVLDGVELDLSTSVGDANFATIAPINLYADLSKATAASINQIRYAFQVQKYLERSNFGSRYFETLSAHYGITSPDARLQRPEYLGGTHFLININQVLSTSGAAAGEDNKVGQLGANSVTINKSNLFSKGFVEFGYVLVCLSSRQGSHKYSQGILREDSRKTRFEFYSPEFANLGDQAILNKEIYVDSDMDKVFGYQEHWAEYRYRPDRVSGLLDPSVTDSLGFWTLANSFQNLPTLSDEFIVETRKNLGRALTTGTTGPDFIADFYFDYTATRELPAYTIPGLVDHFGSM